jgi:hypothetical protein
VFTDTNDYGVYRSYLEPNSIEKDWGSDSDVFRLALVIFGQVPNIKTGKGKLFIIPSYMCCIELWCTKNFITTF